MGRVLAHAFAHLSLMSMGDVQLELSTPGGVLLLIFPLKTKKKSDLHVKLVFVIFIKNKADSEEKSFPFW